MPQVTELTAQLHEAQTRLLLAEEATRQQSAEVVVLKKVGATRGKTGKGGWGLAAYVPW